MEFRIGDFSMITRLTVKTLRFYHDEELLLPSRIDPVNGYRYYNEESLEQARRIALLREMDFSISDIKEILSTAIEDGDTVHFLEKKLSEIKELQRHQRSVELRIKTILKNEKERQMSTYSTDIEIKKIEAVKTALIRYTGRYSEIGKYFGKISSRMGRYLDGKPFALYHDDEYKEGDADISACMPVKKLVQKEGIFVKEFPAAKVLSLVHKGPYENLGDSYGKLYSYLEEQSLKKVGDIREIYLKGPGWIFRGNPQKYVTEIQIPVE